MKKIKQTSKKKKILIVEDEQPIARTLELKLNSHGFSTCTAKNGKDAFSIISNEPLDLILLDLVMPVMDGFDVLVKLKELKHKHPPVFILTNLGQEEDAEKTKELGALHYFVKSDTPLVDIVSHIEKLLN